MTVLIFPDQQADGHRQLLHIQRTASTTIFLSSFLTKANTALREEISFLPEISRSQIPPFNSVVDLSERLQSRKVKRLEISSALHCVYQLATFIQLIESHPDRFPTREDVVVGYGLGQLTAAAVACSPSMVELADVAVEAIRLAFRTAGVVSRWSWGYWKPKLDEDSSWSVKVLDPQEILQEKLDSIQSELDIPRSGKVYISAVNSNFCTISGHPSRLKLITSHPELAGKIQRAEIPTTGLWHAPQIYAEERVADILKKREEYLNQLSIPCRSILSTATGQIINVSAGAALFERVVREILVENVRLDLIEQSLSATKSDNPISILACTIQQTTTQLAAGLATSTGHSVTVEDMAVIVDQRSSQEGIPTPYQIAIVGFSGRFPGAPDVEALWQVLWSGRDMHRQIPWDRFNVETHYDGTGKTNNTSHTPFGCFIEQPGLFDPRFFNMSPREATQTDPMHRLALVTAYEALEMSGFVLNGTPSTQADRVGTFYGQTSDDWREVNAAQIIETYFISGGVRAFAPGRINYHFGFRGPSYSVDTACSSSLAAIQLACTSLRNNECDTAVTGGLNVLTAPDIFSGLSRGQFLSKTGPCKTWDATADGYCRADAVGSVILKRLEDAIADKDKVYGVILATATNHSADAVSITHPHSGNQSELYESVLHMAGVKPEEISYVEMHGTGTQAGDLAETRSVTDVFALPGARSAAESLYIGAVKSNIGHSEAAAGVSSLIKVLLMLQKHAIPPHVGIKNTINPALPDFGALNVTIPFKQTPWTSSGKPRIAFINNFSAAGGNTAMLLQEPPSFANPTGQDPRPILPFVFSAKSLLSLKNNIVKMIDWVRSNREEVSLPSLSSTLTARRMHHNYRIGLTASDTAGLISALQSHTETAGLSPVPSNTPQVGFVFTGQGAFYSKLGHQIYELSSEFRAEIDYLNQVSTSHGFPSILPAIHGDQETATLSPLVTQLTMVSVQIALVKLWESWNIRPSVVVGHSLGEYAALYAAGVLSAEDTIYLVAKRAQLLETKCTAGTHAMIAVKGSVDEIHAGLSGALFEVVCLNSPTDTVLSSEGKDVPELEQRLKAAGYKFRTLDLPYAFHSAQLDPILDDFERIATGAVYNTPRVPVISPRLGRVVTPEDDAVFNATYLASHTREPVQFCGAVQDAMELGLLEPKTILLEVGPHPICTPMVNSSTGGNFPAVPSLKRDEDPWKTLTIGLCTLHCAGLRVDWRHFNIEYDASHELLSLPSYSFDEKNYWIDYVNDWCLYKIEPRTANVTEILPSAPVVSKLSTTSVHRITSEEFGDNCGIVITQSILSNPTLRAVVLGHRVNDIGLCPSSLYADMAMTVCNYILQEWKPDWVGKIGLNCSNMEVMKPLIVRGPETKQILQFINEQGKEIEAHATCTVTFEEQSIWMDNWAPHAYWVTDRISMLRDNVKGNRADHISRKLAYKLFAALVSYTPPFQGMDEVVFDSANFEGTARVVFQTEDKDGSYDVNPFWIDSVAHLSGFILNGSGATDPKEFVYISHGWKSMRLGRPLNRSTIYTSYVKMQPQPNNVMSGDVYILDGEDIVGVVGGLKFQRIPRKILNSVLPSIISSTTTAVPPKQPVETPKQVKMASNPAPRAKTQPEKSISPPKAVVPAAHQILEQAMRIVAEESDLDPSELQDDTEIASLGIDSLLSLQIAGKIREDLDLDIQNSAFLANLTLGDFKKYLQTFVSTSCAESFAASTLDSESIGSESSWENGSRATWDDFNIIPTPRTPRDGKKEKLRLLIRSTIATEMGVPLDEVSGSNDLASLGLDSLMAICVIGQLREKTDLTLPSSLFIDHNSIDAVEQFLGLVPSEEKILAQDNRPRRKTLRASTTPAPKAVSLLLQGKPSTASKVLFLFPDGSGSATSYAGIPPIDPSIAVFGLNCPFMENPSSFTIGIEGVSSLYLEEVRRRQPYGPYYLGGWSAGGIVAYEVTQQLIAAGERVEQLVFFDSPCPIKLEALPKRLHEFFAEIGLLGSNGQEPPAWLVPHFTATIQALSAYNPVPIRDPSKIPKTLAIWARHGVCRYPTDPRPVATVDEPKSMTWLLDNRTDFGFNGWDALLGPGAMKTKNIDGNHFTMMKDEEQLHEMAAYLKQFLC